MDTKTAINEGRTYLGIEFGSTRIKAVLIDDANEPVASGAHEWENKFENGVWTYALNDVWAGLQDAYAKLVCETKEKYGVVPTTFGAMGFSAMMHGYLPFDRDGKQLAEFRTWRNTITGEAADKLSTLFGFSIPQRWSIAHLYQAILNGEPHVKDIAFLTTLAGYVHWQLCGEKVLGVGEASGMFPIDSASGSYDAVMADKFDNVISDKGFSWKLRDILPNVVSAGTSAGTLSEAGAKLIDPSGALKAGVPLCPPEGDAGTGMTATNSVAARTGNVSAGTSVFAMVVLERPLSKLYPEIDMVTTPTGKPVAMVHCNNCTPDINAWVSLFSEMSEAAGAKLTTPQLFDIFYNKALEGESECGGLLSYNYFSGEHITHIEQGRPMLVRKPDSRFTFANLARCVLFSALGTLKIGMDILFVKENVKLERLLGHGGLFKTKLVGQKLMAAASGASVDVMKTAGEGGPWGMALLASYMVNKQPNETLEDYLEKRVFASMDSVRVQPDPADVEGFAKYMERFSAGLAIESAAAAME